mmetsp:Transcript_5151/g.14450  ORF Transcript_5151/g.14450 Transcript_5151/m.14450 type:complete len:89 (+) Transcript_5151:744-1010(+)
MGLDEGVGVEGVELGATVGIGLDVVVGAEVVGLGVMAVGEGAAVADVHSNGCHVTSVQYFMAENSGHSVASTVTFVSSDNVAVKITGL